MLNLQVDRNIDSTQQDDRLRAELEALRAEYRDFVYAVTHDLAGPLRQIEGFASIIVSAHGEKFDEKTKRHFDLIIGGSDKGKTILDALLAHSRLITADLSYTRIDCSGLIENVTSELSELISKTDTEIQYKGGMATVAPVVFGDSNQLYQLFYHILHNALHYRKPATSPRISIETKELDNQWLFSITDNGIGIRGKMADRIFTALKRGVAENDFAGMGMGLTIAKSVVQRHGGEIWLTSEPDSGSSFYFTLGKEN